MKAALTYGLRESCKGRWVGTGVRTVWYLVVQGLRQVQASWRRTVDVKLTVVVPVQELEGFETTLRGGKGGGNKGRWSLPLSLPPCRPEGELGPCGS